MEMPLAVTSLILTIIETLRCSRALGISDAVAAAVLAADHEIVDLSGLRMQQDRPAISTAIIDGVRACDQDGRGVDERNFAGRRNYFEPDIRML